MRTRFLFVAMFICLSGAIGSAQVRLAQVPGAPGRLDESTGIVFNTTGNIGFLSNPGSGLVQKFRPATGEVLESLSLPPGIGPLALSGDERTLVVLGVTTQKLYIIDAEKLQVLREAGYDLSGFTARTNIVLSPDRVNFYISDPARAAVAVFNMTTGALDRYLRVDKNPNIITMLPDGRHIAVLCSGKKPADAESIWIIDTFRIAVVDNPVLPQSATEPFNNIQSSVDGAFLFVASSGDNRLLTYDLTSRVSGSRGLLDPAGGPPGQGPAKVVASPNGRWLAVVNVTSKTLSLVRLPDALVATSIEVPGFEPTTETVPAFSADSHTLYIPAAASSDIVAYDVETMAVQKRIPTAATPTRLSLSTDGALLTSLDVGGNVLSVIALKPTSTYIPHFTQTTQDYSGLGLMNLGAEPENLTVMAKDNAGVLLPGANNPRVLTIAPRQQLSVVVGQILGLNAGDVLDGYIEVYSLSPEIKILYLTGTVAQTQLDGYLEDPADATPRLGTWLGFGRITEGGTSFGSQNATTISLLNPNETEASISMRLYANTQSRPGTIIASRDVKLPAHGRLSGRMSQLLPSGRYPINSAYLEIDSDVDLVGLSIVKIGDSIALLPATVRGQDVRTWDGVQFVSGGAGVLDTPIFSNLSIANYSATPVTFTAQVTDANGNIIPADAEPVRRTMQPYESIAGGADELFGFPNPLTDPALYQGTLHMQADDKGLIVSLLFGDALNGKYLAAEGLNSQRSNKFILLHFAEGSFDESSKGQYYTGLAMYNPNGQPAHITVEAFSPGNVLIAKGKVTVEHGSRLSKTLGQIIPALAGKAATGFVVVTSDLPIMLFEVFGSSRSEFLASVAPVIVP